MAFESLTRFANPPTNTLGTSLFLSYIALALYFTTDIISALRFEKGKSHAPRSPNERRRLRMLSVVSATSFAVLSFHMLMFLINSFLAWKMSGVFFGTDAGQKSELGIVGDVWRWMMETSLFESFAKELVAKGESAVWSQIALLGNWFWGVWICERATTAKLPKEEMYAFIALSQILPISFTVSLFLIRLQISAPSSTARKIAKQQKKDKSSGSAAQSNGKTSNPTSASRKSGFRISLPVSTILLNILLLLLPSSRTTPYFIPAGILTRLILLLPQSGAVYVWSDDVWLASILLSAGFVAANVNLVLAKQSQNWSRDVLGELWTGGHAVKALSWDAIIGAALAVWLGLGEGI